MKKIFLILLGLALFYPALAQTNFRDVTYREAIAAAKAEKKQVFIDFYTSWCGPCKMMMKNVFPLKEVGDYLNARFVCVKIDAEKGEGPELAKRYKVKAYPTFVAIDPDEEVLMTKEGGTFDGGEFIGSIDRLINPDKSPERLQQRYEGGERSADLVSAYAGMKMEQVYQNRRSDMSKKDEAFNIVQDYFNGLNDRERLKEENLFIYASFTESPMDAIAQYMIANRDKFTPAIKDRIEDRIATLYKMEIQKYITAQEPFDQQQYDALKKGVLDLGLNKDNYYTEAFRMIECYGKGDLNVFLSLLEKEYGELNREYKASMMYNYAQLFTTGDEAVKARAVKFLRSLLVDMDAGMLMFVAQQLLILEGKIH